MKPLIIFLAPKKNPLLLINFGNLIIYITLVIIIIPSITHFLNPCHYYKLCLAQLTFPFRVTNLAHLRSFSVTNDSETNPHGPFEKIHIIQQPIIHLSETPIIQQPHSMPRQWRPGCPTVQMSNSYGNIY